MNLYSLEQRKGCAKQLKATPTSINGWRRGSPSVSSSGIIIKEKVWPESSGVTVCISTGGWAALNGVRIWYMYS